MNKELLIKTINQIEGYGTRLKELHWSSSSRSLHVIIDDFQDKLGEFEDAFVENSIALLGFVYPGDLSPVLPTPTEYEELLENIRGMVISIKRELDDLAWGGLVNILDDFHTEVNRAIYLAKITKHEA